MTFSFCSQDKMVQFLSFNLLFFSVTLFARLHETISSAHWPKDAVPRTMTDYTILLQNTDNTWYLRYKHLFSFNSPGSPYSMTGWKP